MKKLTVLVLALIYVFSLAGCANKAGDNDISVAEISEDKSDDIPDDIPLFSYKEELKAYKENDPGVHFDGFNNVSVSEVSTSQQAVDRAKNECIIKYDATKVSYDSAAGMWKVYFYREGTSDMAYLGGDKTVYLDNSGLTHLIVCGE